MPLKITTLIENTSKEDFLCSEHGLSLFIEYKGINILFDTGRSGDFISNAEKLKVDLSHLDYVIISHSHYDHGGGFNRLIEQVGGAFNLLVGENFFVKKYVFEDNSYKFIGSFDEKYVHDNHIPLKKVNENVYSITEDIMLFTNFERKTDYEKISNRFFVSKDNTFESDDFSDEIVLGIKTEKGLLVIVGCSHPGIVNILNTIIDRTQMPIYGVIGGTHLNEADENRLNITIDYFKEKGIKLIGLSHCTGEEAVKEFEKSFGDEFVMNNTGNIIRV